MNKLLIINASSAPSESSRSQSLMRYFISLWKKQSPNDQLVFRNLAESHIPHLDATTIQAFYTDNTKLTAALRQSLKLSDCLIQELMDANILIFVCPMYNFTITSSLKAYFDLVARVGKTFEYSENGPVGLVHGKQAFVITTRGGYYVDHPDDLQEPYFKTMLRFLGITDLLFFHADGVDISPESLEKGMACARESIDTYFENF